MADILQVVSECDLVVQSYPPAGSQIKEVRRRIRAAIQDMAKLSLDASMSLSGTLSLAAKSCPSTTKRALAAVMIRLVSSTNILTERDMQNCRKDIVNLVETAFPDLVRGLFQSADQNHEKLEAIKTIHETACDQLADLLHPFASLQDLAKRRQTIMKSINHRKSRAYLTAFGYDAVRPLMESLLGQVESVTESQGHQLQTTMEQLVEDIPVQLEQCERIGTFVTSEYAIPFLRRLQAHADAMKERLAADFACKITIPGNARTAQKRCPLHLVGATLEISLALNNDGPGVAQNVTAYCLADNCEVKNPETALVRLAPDPSS